MKVYSNIKPNIIEITNNDFLSTIRLNKNIVENIQEYKYQEPSKNELDEDIFIDNISKIISYAFDQVVLTMDYRPQLKNDIISNFDLYFDYGLKLENEKLEQIELENKLNNLMSGGIIEANNITTSQIMNILMENMKLKNTNKTLMDQLVTMSMDIMKIKMKLGVK